MVLRYCLGLGIQAILPVQYFHLITNRVLGSMFLQFCLSVEAEFQFTWCQPWRFSRGAGHSRFRSLR